MSQSQFDVSAGISFYPRTAETLVRMSTATRPIVFVDINIGETPAGRIKMELFSDIVPKSVTILPSPFFECSVFFRTAENFRQMCTGEYRCVVPQNKMLYDSYCALGLMHGRKGIRVQLSTGTL